MKELSVRVGKYLLYLLFFSAVFSFFANLLSENFPNLHGVVSVAAALLFLYTYVLRLRRCRRHHRIKTYMTVSLSALCLYAALALLALQYLPDNVFDGFFGITRVFTLIYSGKKIAFSLFFGILFVLTIFFPLLYTLFHKLSDALAAFWMRLFHLDEPFHLSAFLHRVTKPLHKYLDFLVSPRYWKLFFTELFLLFLFSSLISSLCYLVLTGNLLKASLMSKLVSIGIATFIFLLYFIFHLASYAGMHRKQTYYRVCILSYLAYAALDVVVFAFTSVTVNHYFFFVSHLVYYTNMIVWKVKINKLIWLLIQHLIMLLLIPLIRMATFRYARYAARKDPLWMRFDKFTDRISASLERPTIAIAEMSERR
ncbi:MAG: hypothetical protein IJS44_02875, partial [Clostridia bacterium]|nr:hypothetical protein [Clostridia bacterium]